MDPSRFQTASMANHPRGGDIRRILAAALQAVDPGVAVKRALNRQGDELHAGGRTYRLPDFRQVFVVGAGKAAAPMANATAEVIGDYLTTGLVITKDGHAEPGGKAIRQVEAAHPIPDSRGAAATDELLALLRSAGASDLVICLVSGGGSALLTAPEPEIGLEGLQSLTEQLLASGADIHEINIVRKHLSRVKGGGLAKTAYPAEILTLILSDVVGDDLDVIASGPTVPDSSTFSDAERVLETFGIPVPQRLRSGAKGELPDTPKPGDPAFQKVQNILIGTNRMAAEAALREAESLGLSARLLTGHLTGEARLAGETLGARIGEMPPNACWLAGGETTVTLGEAPGRGGRNQEMALAAVEFLAGWRGRFFVALATDGGDGSTDAAGAVTAGDTLFRAKMKGLDPQDFLQRHDSYLFFDQLGDLLRPGPTKTNVNDLVFLFSFEEANE